MPLEGKYVKYSEDTDHYLLNFKITVKIFF